MGFYQYDETGLTRLANKVKDQLASALNIPELDDHVVVIQEPGIFGRFWTKVTGKEPDEALRILVLTASEPYADPEPKGRDDLPESQEKPFLKVVGRP